MIRDIVNKFQQRFRQKENKKPRYRTVICAANGSRTEGSPWADERRKLVYHQLFGSGSVGKAVCEDITPELGLGCYVEPDNFGLNWRIIQDDTFLRYSATDNRNYQTVSPSDLQPGGRLFTWLQSKAVLPLATRPQPTGLLVDVTDGYYSFGGEMKYFAGYIGLALTQNPTPGEHYMAGLYLDASNALQVVYGASVSIDLTPPDPTWPDDTFPLSVVRINDSQTGILFLSDDDIENDVFDRRLNWSGIRSGNAWPTAGQNLLGLTNYATVTDLIAAMSDGDVGYLGPRTSSEAVVVNKAITLVGTGSRNCQFTSAWRVTGVGNVVLRGLSVQTTSGTYAMRIEVDSVVYLTDVFDACSNVGSTAYGLQVQSGGFVYINNDCLFNSVGTPQADIRVDTGGSASIFGATLLTDAISNAGTINGAYRDSNGEIHLTGTGGTSQYVKQETANGALSVGVIAAADLPADTALIKAKNTSGATAAAGDVGYINYAGEYKTTTTALATVNWCVVTTGGANNADIYVVRRGRVTVNYTGSAPSAGDYLVTSTSAGDAQQQTTMHPAVFAVCAAAGSGGTVEAILLTGRATVPFSSSNNLLQMTSVSLSDFVATQNGAPSGANITYNAPSSGNENTINPAAATELGKIIIHNTTRGTSAQLQATNTGTNVMTFTSSADVSGWQNGDTLTARSQTNTDTISSSYFYDVAIDTGFAEVDALAVGFIPYTLLLDNAAAKNFRYHSYEAGAAAKRNTFNTQVASVNFIFTAPPVPLINRRYCVNWEANGAGTMTFTTRIFALIIATP